jgi:uncharacterized protein (TIGR03083 family)
MTRLTERQWQMPVVTAQGRTVPATEVPWMRCREVWVHAADLATGTSFGDLPPSFLAALCDDVAAKRATAAVSIRHPALMLTATDADGRWELPGDGAPIQAAGPLADVCAYLTGRAHGLVRTGGPALPELPAWL